MTRHFVVLVLLVCHAVATPHVYHHAAADVQQLGLFKAEFTVALEGHWASELEVELHATIADVNAPVSIFLVSPKGVEIPVYSGPASALSCGNSIDVLFKKQKSSEDKLPTSATCAEGLNALGWAPDTVHHLAFGQWTLVGLAEGVVYKSSKVSFPGYYKFSEKAVFLDDIQSSVCLGVSADGTTYRIATPQNKRITVGSVVLTKACNKFKTAGSIILNVQSVQVNPQGLIEVLATKGHLDDLLPEGEATFSFSATLRASKEEPKSRRHLSQVGSGNGAIVAGTYALGNDDEDGIPTPEVGVPVPGYTAVRDGLYKFEVQTAGSIDYRGPASTNPRCVTTATTTWNEASILDPNGNYGGVGGFIKITWLAPATFAGNLLTSFLSGVIDVKLGNGVTVASVDLNVTATLDYGASIGASPFESFPASLKTWFDFQGLIRQAQRDTYTASATYNTTNYDAPIFQLPFCPESTFQLYKPLQSGLTAFNDYAPAPNFCVGPIWAEGYDAASPSKTVETNVTCFATVYVTLNLTSYLNPTACRGRTVYGTASQERRATVDGLNSPFYESGACALGPDSPSALVGQGTGLNVLYGQETDFLESGIVTQSSGRVSTGSRATARARPTCYIPGCTPTATPSPSPTRTATPTVTPTSSATPSTTPSTTETPTASPSATATTSPTDTPTPSPSSSTSPSPTATPTNTPTPTPSSTPTSTPSSTPTPTPSSTPTPTNPAATLPAATQRPTPICNTFCGSIPCCGGLCCNQICIPKTVTIANTTYPAKCCETVDQAFGCPSTWSCCGYGCCPNNGRFSCGGGNGGSSLAGSCPVPGFNGVLGAPTPKPTPTLNYALQQFCCPCNTQFCGVNSCCNVRNETCIRGACIPLATKIPTPTRK